jgi:uncharacterized protein YjbI with pentapeptide repeats
MNTPDRLPLKSPTNLLKRDVRDLKADVGKLFSALGKTGVSVGFQNWGQVGKDVIEALTALGLKQDQEVLAWLWIRQAMQKCSSSLCDHNRNILPENLNFKDFEDRLNQALAEDALFIDNEFCQHFDQHSLTKILQNCFTDWLVANQVKAESITEISKSFNAYFIFNLHQEAKTNTATYQPIEWRIKQLNEKAGETEKAWLKYGLLLQEQVDEALFGVEDFSLRQIYIPLRAYLVREKKNQPKNQEKEYERVVMDLPLAIRDWLQQEDKRDGLRIICGGPGCGKSSFTKMLAAELAERGDRVLWIPLHLLDPTKDLVKGLDELIANDFDNRYPPNPLKKEQFQQHLLVILDGLDELAMQATEVAQQFLQQVKKDLQLFNQSSLRVQVLVSGRELVVQHLGEAKDSQQILHLLPYWLSEEDLKKDNYVDDQALLEIDQRQDWWRRYGELKQKNYLGLPEKLAKIATLQEITAQPLLNYLVVLSYEAGELDFSQEININQIYDDLLNQIYKRDWELKRPHPTIADIDKEDFVKVMGNIAIACWHNKSRTTTLSNVQDFYIDNDSDNRAILEQFKMPEKQRLTNLMTAFYFRKKGFKEKGTFEFTHKTFQEYLTVRRIVTEIIKIEKKLTEYRNNTEQGWNEKECLLRWAVLCGEEAMDFYLFDWLLGEIQLLPVEQVAQWQQLFCDLISYMLRQGMPMEELKGLTFLQMNQQSRNAEEALLVVLNICARVTRKVSTIDWHKKPERFGEWLSKLQGQRTNEDNTLTFDCLSYLDLANCTLILKDLYSANLQRAILYELNLQEANLEKADLQEAKLQGAKLAKANLRWANLQGAYLFGAHLVEANLRGADLKRAYLQRADLRWTDLRWAKLQGAYLEEAILTGAELRKGDLEGVNTKNVDLSQVIWVDNGGNPLNKNP